MPYSTKYRKPNMTNLPSELGVRIFKHILSTPKPDFAKMQEEAVRLEREMIKVREREGAKENALK